MRKLLYIIFFIVLVFGAFYGGFVYKAKMSGQSANLGSFIQQFIHKKTVSESPTSVIDVNQSGLATQTQITDIIWQKPEKVDLDLTVAKPVVPVTYYQVGKINSGVYMDANIYLVTHGAVEYGGDPVYYILGRDNVYSMLSTTPQNWHMDPKTFFTPEWTLFDQTKLSIDDSFKIDIAPKKITINGSNMTLELISSSPNPFSNYNEIFFNQVDFKKSLITETGEIIYTKTKDTLDGHFYTLLPDGRVGIYKLIVPGLIFPSNQNNYDDVNQINGTWSDGSQIGKYTPKAFGGCGLSGYLNIVEVNKNTLKIAGKLASGESIYLSLETNNKIYQDLYDQMYKDPENPLTYEDFVKQKPVFFWIDPLGRVVQFTYEKFRPAAECGKPVIYLYPTHDMNVNVKVTPQGGFSFTEPSYDMTKGWDVFATTQSVITDLRDNKTYPYLFWEGRGGLYQTPEKGWSVAQKDVPNFITEKLTAFGLNQKEIADFSEFWLPKMKDAPYYFITFMGNQTMNDIAPLNITPRPDTTIRVLMDYKELDKPIDVTGFPIHTPERKGFTVVEWGGVLQGNIK